VIADFPIVSFDTSAHNRLVDDGPLSEPVIAGLKSGLFFRFVGHRLQPPRGSCADRKYPATQASKVCHAVQPEIPAGAFFRARSRHH